jgi:hypothetical protein
MVWLIVDVPAALKSSAWAISVCLVSGFVWVAR